MEVLLHVVSLRDEVRSSEVRKAVNTESRLFPIARYQLRWLGQVPRMSHQGLAWGSSVDYIHSEATQRPAKARVD